MSAFFKRTVLPPAARAEAAFWELAAGRAPAFLRRRPGQATVEYLLMLGVVATVAVVFVTAFHKMILGGIFTIAGMVLGAGTPKAN